MKNFSLVLSLIALSLTLLSCNGGDDDDDLASTPQQEDTNGSSSVSVIYDSEITPTEKQALDVSTKRIETFGIDGSRIKGFSQIFGGNASSNVVTYVNTRVKYFISVNTEWQDRLVVASIFPSNTLAFYGANPSAFIWYTAKLNEPSDVNLLINNTEVDIDSTRVGVIQVGDIFTDVDTASQAITIVHEARHSDCPGGALATDLERLQAGFPPEKRDCGQLHGVCTQGPNAGGSCDVIPWGAYAVDYIYSLGIADACDSCTETEKQNALINANQVENSSIFDFTQMQDGAFGSPDMSSSNEVR